MKRLFALLLTFAMIVSMLPVSFADDDMEADLGLDAAPAEEINFLEACEEAGTFYSDEEIEALPEADFFEVITGDTEEVIFEENAVPAEDEETDILEEETEEEVVEEAEEATEAAEEETEAVTEAVEEETEAVTEAVEEETEAVTEAVEVETEEATEAIEEADVIVEEETEAAEEETEAAEEETEAAVEIVPEEETEEAISEDDEIEEEEEILGIIENEEKPELQFPDRIDPEAFVFPSGGFQSIYFPENWEVPINNAGDSFTFIITPYVTDDYRFYSVGSDDTVAALYDSDGAQINYDDDGGAERNFELSQHLEAGYSYYLCVKYYNSSVAGRMTVNMEGNLPYVRYTPGTYDLYVPADTGSDLIFVPIEDGIYSFFTEIDYLDPTARLTEDNGTLDIYSDDSGPDDTNFFITAVLYQGHAYRLHVADCHAETDTDHIIPVQIKQSVRILSTQLVSNGIKMTWEPIWNAVSYNVGYFGDIQGDYASYNTTDTTFTFTNLASGQTYFLNVDPAYSSGILSPSVLGVSVYYIAAPTLTLSNAANGVTLKWNEVPGAESYIIYYKTPSSTSWVKKTTVTGTSYTFTGLTSGTNYSFTIRAVGTDNKGFTVTSGYKNAGWSIKYLSAPVLVSATPTTNGVTVKWNAVSGAAKYGVFCKSGSGSWEKKGITTATSYTVTGLTTGTTYKFTVRCMNADGTKGLSAYNTTGLSATVPSAPKLVSVANAANGVTVKWNAVSGAVRYAVFCKTGSGSWEKKGTTTATSYTVTGLTSGTRYSFTVRQTNAAGTSCIGGYDTTGKSITYLAAPTISSVTNAVNGVTVKWNAVSGAVCYAVFCKTNSGSWVQKGTTTATSYTVTGLNSGVVYSFTVRCTTADGKTFTSGYNTTGKTVTYLAAPAITSVTNAVNGVTVNWDSVPGAARYAIFFKSGSGSWVKKGTTTATSYTVTGLNSGIVYSFTVRCVSADGNTNTSAYNTTGKSINYIAAPVISSLTNASNGVTVQWNAVPGAVKYRVFKKTGTGSWTKVNDTAGTSLTVTGLTSGVTYYFTVRCLSANGSTFTSAYNTTGKSITYRPASSSYGGLGDLAWYANTYGTLSSYGYKEVNGAFQTGSVNFTVFMEYRYDQDLLYFQAIGRDSSNGILIDGSFAVQIHTGNISSNYASVRIQQNDTTLTGTTYNFNNNNYTASSNISFSNFSGSITGDKNAACNSALQYVVAEVDYYLRQTFGYTLNSIGFIAY